MASSLTWLDYSERDRRDAMAVIDLFRETGTVDELGLSRVQFSIANLFFPGTTTIQTRACYFLLVPWMFRELEHRKISSDQFANRARQTELAINRHLRSGEDTSGVFGIRAGDALKRPPSDVYWDGLESWGIRYFQGFMGAYFRSLDDFYGRVARHKILPADPEHFGAPPTNWHPHLPEPPQGFPRNGFTVALRPEDARYLREQIMAHHPDSLLAVMAGRANAADLNADRPWDLAGSSGVSAELQEQLADAERFAICMQGAALLYNLMLAELREREDWIAGYRDDLGNWAERFELLDPGLAYWRPDRIWSLTQESGGRVGYPTRSFVERWVSMLKNAGPAMLADDDSEARALVRSREIHLKRSRARLTNPRRLELWSGESGTWLMDFRWGSAKRLLADIFDGMARSGEDAGDA
ncbi:MAG: hypothetical protein F4Y67_04480 [Chloroflexi bacterium]|nr:hypothetical protein [Chloroflexota bacterium]